jgi:4-hydroxy-4-methyl-2-oxoglutarate aldolase
LLGRFPFAIRAAPGDRRHGDCWAVPVRHAGSVDFFLEALDAVPTDGILVVDNAGRRDSAAIRALRIPLWSLGATPGGPRDARDRPADAFARAWLGDVEVRPGDLVAADDDGVVVVPAWSAADVLVVAHEIAEREHGQVHAMQAGKSLRAQLQFDRYLERRRRDST